MHDRRGGGDDSERQMIKVMMIRITLEHCHMILIFCFSHQFTFTQISEKFIHPEYDNPARANDVALLKLESAATMGKTVSPACLPDQVLYCCLFVFDAGCLFRVTLGTPALFLRVPAVYLAGKVKMGILMNEILQSLDGGN